MSPVGEGHSGHTFSKKQMRRIIIIIILIAMVHYLASCTITHKSKTEIKMKKLQKTQRDTIYQSKNSFIPTGEINNDPSETVQGETYSIQELFQRHVSGTMPDIGLDPQYDYEEASHEDDTTLRKPDLDLTDIDNIKTQIEETSSKLSKTKQAKEDKAKATKEAKATDELTAKIKQELQDGQRSEPVKVEK